MRLQKLLASSGLGSRRGCEEIISAGRVTVNGAVAVIGANVSPEDKVRVDGKPLRTEITPLYIALHKPIGYTSDHGSDDFNNSALNLVKLPQRLYPVGRLDKDSSGLLLLTNDGDLAYQLTHPKFEHEKEYRALVAGNPNQDTLRRWRNGVLLDGELEKTAKCEVSVIRVIEHAAVSVGREAGVREPRALGRGQKTAALAPLRTRSSHRETSHTSTIQRQPPDPRPFHERGETWLRIVLHEGRKRQIRRVGKVLGHSVKQLVRVRIGSLTLGNLMPGQWRQLQADEVKRLMGNQG